MKDLLALLVLMFLMTRCAESVFPCPDSLKESSTECSCSDREDELTIVVCPGIYNTSHLEEATKPLKSMVVDRLLILNAFSGYSVEQELAELETETTTNKTITSPVNGILPKKWLSELRVRDLELRNTNLNGFFLTDDAFEGQAKFLTRLVVRNAGLGGHMCSSCAPGLFTVSTKGLRRAPLLKYVDFSHNHLQILDGNVFPYNLRQLSRVTLGSNHIGRINDNAFANLAGLKHLDLSHNRLTTISRRIFRMSADSSITTLDLSYNAINTLPEDMFQGLTGLRQVKLNHNLLETLPGQTWIRLPSAMEKIDLRGNFLVCNCTSTWISRRISEQTELVGNCIAPKSVEFQELKPSLPTLNSCG